MALGDCYLYGLGTKKSPENAARVYTIALEHGILAAKEKLEKLENLQYADNEETNEEGGLLLRSSL